jgi:hypothetical protein
MWVPSMSLRCEQRRALLLTREFLGDLVGYRGKRWPNPLLRDRASRCLRHFPFLAADGEPLWSLDEKTRENRAVSLVDGAYDVVELWEPTNPAQKKWKRDWLRGAWALGANSAGGAAG